MGVSSFTKMVVLQATMEYLLSITPGRSSCCPCAQSHLDDIEAHVDDVLGAGAVVTGTGVALEGVTQVPAVQVMVAQVIVTTPGTWDK
jgi:hypothetical protein